MLDSSNPKIEVYPTLLSTDKGTAYKQFLTFRVSLKSDNLHENAVVTALADGKEGTLEAKLEVTDVVAAPVVEPPVEMEFRPADTVGQPNKKHNANLYLNLGVIPLGRKVEISVIKSQGGLTLVDNGGKKTKALSIVVTKEHQVSETAVARIPVPWIGGGWGQFARIMAETKTPAGKVVTAIATLTIDQQEEGGLIRRIEYRDLGNQKCSDLVDSCIYINSAHALNRSVFGATKEEYANKVDNDRTAQYRLCAVVTEQSVYRLAEDLYLKNKLLLVPTAPITSMREFVDAKTDDFAPKLLKILVTSD